MEEEDGAIIDRFSLKENISIFFSRKNPLSMTTVFFYGNGMELSPNTEKLKMFHEKILSIGGRPIK